MEEEFNPAVHLADENGSPVKNADGSLRKMNAGQKSAYEKAYAEPKSGHAEHKTRRRKRSQFGPQLKLQADERKGFQRRWFNDKEGRVQTMQTQDDYEPVKDENGQVIRRPVGGGTEAVLMEIPEEWYAENQAEKRKLVQDPSKMKEALVGEGEYTPDDKDSALR